jgi:excisionase family DNA binding protein
MKDYLTVKEAARNFKKHPSTIRRWIRARQLKAEKVAGKFGLYLISRSDMLEFMMSKVMEKQQ